MATQKCYFLKSFEVKILLPSTWFAMRIAKRITKTFIFDFLSLYPKGHDRRIHYKFDGYLDIYKQASTLVSLSKSPLHDKIKLVQNFQQPC